LTERAELAFLYLASGPVVHLVNERPLTAAGSLGPRLGVPLAFTGIASAARGACKRTNSYGEEESDLGCSVAPYAWGAIGACLAMLIDAAALSWKTREPRPATPALVPRLVLRRGFASAGVSVSF
jgi:hypothetical protein